MKQRQIVSGSRRAMGLYALLLATLALAGVLGFQAYDSARSHRATAQQTLRDYAQLANWRYEDWASKVLENSLSGAISALGSYYQVHAETLWSPSALLDQQLKKKEHWIPMPDIDYAIRVEREGLSIESAGAAPETNTLERIAENLVSHADTAYDPSKDWFKVLHDPNVGGSKTFVYTLRQNRSGAVYLYAFEVSVKELAVLLKKYPPKEPLLPKALTGNLPNEALLSVAVSSPSLPTMVVVGDSLSKDYFASESMSSPFNDLVISVGLNPEIAESLVIGGLPASRLPVVVGAFVLTTFLIVGAAHQIRRENELARLRSAFATGVSHELRTPLTQIRMFLESVLLGRTVSNEQKQQYLEIAHEEAKRLSHLVDNVLRFSKVERGAARVNTSQINLTKTLESIIESLPKNPEGEPVALRLSLEEEIPVQADAEAIRAIVTNLVDNATKYGPPDQTISIGAVKTDRFARMWVSDEGPGIPKEGKRRIWEPYYRLERDSSSAVAGTGIGLSIVQEFVRLHGGSAWVEDGDTGGARFVVELPLQNGSSVASE